MKRCGITLPVSTGFELERIRGQCRGVGVRAGSGRGRRRSDRWRQRHRISASSTQRRLAKNEEVKVAEGVLCWRERRRDRPGRALHPRRECRPALQCPDARGARTAGRMQDGRLVRSSTQGWFGRARSARGGGDCRRSAGLQNRRSPGGGGHDSRDANRPAGGEDPRARESLGPDRQTAGGFYGVAIDMVAGPSEVLVIADETADPGLVASDLIAQAEHGSDSQAILVSPSERIIQASIREVTEQLRDLPRREYAGAGARSELCDSDVDSGAGL